MTYQLTAPLLDACVLGIVDHEDSYGYKIIKDLKPILDLSESTLYTILKRLIDDQMVVVRSEEFEGRLRKYYHITNKGKQRIEDFKNEWQELMNIYSFIVEEDKL